MESTAVKTGLTDQELDAMAERVLSEGQFDLPADGEGAEEILTDEYGLPFEPEGCYNSAPLAFEEMVQALWIVTNNAHYAATRYNRHSPTYMLLSDYLEKNIRQLGSCCITKAVLEKSGEEFTLLDNVSLHELYCMVSLHFRKCISAYNEVMGRGDALDMNIISRMFRWAALAERLKATEDKIQKIREGKINIDSMLERARVYKNEPGTRRDKSADTVNPRLRASSLPVMRSFANEIKRQNKEAEWATKREQLEAERARKRLERGGIIEPGSLISPGRTINPGRFIPPMKIPEIRMEPGQLRKLLADEAKSRGDFSEAEIIAHEDFDLLMERFRKLRDEGRIIDKKPGTCNMTQADRSRMGPSDETRKKLREKRKKKK